VDYLVKFRGGEKFVHRANISEVAVNKGEWFAECRNVRKRATFDLRVVKVIQVIERPDVMAVVEQAFANVRANEARAAGDEKIHTATLTTLAPTVERDAVENYFFGGKKNLVSSAAILVFHWKNKLQ